MDYKVSIIVPCYNHSRYLGEALESVLKQVYSNWECIIVDDGSTDNTEEIVRKFVTEDSRFQYFYKENQGLSSARNFGINKCEGSIILPLDADDKISVDYIENAITAFKDNPSIKVVYCLAEKFGKESGLWALKPFSLFNLSRMNMIFCSALFRKVEWEKAGGYDLNMKYGWEDWDFWISILKNGGSVKRLDFVGFYYRISDKNMHRMMTRDQYDYLYEYLSVKHADFFVKYFGSFHYMHQQAEKKENEFLTIIKSEKFVIDLFVKKFFGFTIFNKKSYKNRLR
ncbi:glycosyltransferase family 2 protein [Christiangramia crocea]|uniref:Glycosyltransferase family 2 protein n=1 Tax=Christiangramia crocea TaxID=2904124 RepID=A0A9X2A9L2_9FLAO|nr:glycosyltransferase family A protein [Gramella crocea]MCG9973023.1 glycosyltransferase family 2 protein [Gramella crocea]